MRLPSRVLLRAALLLALPAAAVACWRLPVALQGEALTGVTLLDCAMVRADGVCEVGPNRTLRLRVAPSGGLRGDDRVVVQQEGSYPPLTPEDDGEPSESTRKLRIYTLVVNPNVAQIRVTLQGPSTPRRTALLTLREWRPPQWYVDAQGQIDASHLGEARATLERGLVSADQEARALALGALALIDQDEGRFADAEAHLREASMLDRERGLVSAEIQHGLQLAMLLADHLGRAPEATAIIPSLRRLVGRQTEQLPWLDLQEGYLALLRGEYRVARGFVERGLRAAKQHGMRTARIELLELQAEADRGLGWTRAAEDNLETLARKEREPCWLGLIRANQGEGRIQALERRPATQRRDELDPRPPLLDALALFTSTSCLQPSRQAQVILLLARAALLDGRVEEVTRWLQALAPLAGAAGALSPAVTAEAELLRGELALLQEKRAALRERAPLRQQARAHLSRVQRGHLPRARQWLVTFALARVAEDEAEELGAFNSAPGKALSAPAREAARAVRAAYREVERTLDEWGPELPLGGGAGTFLAQYQRTTDAHAEVLIKLGSPGEALTVSRHARQRALGAFLFIEQTAALGLEREKDAYLESQQELSAALANAALGQARLPELQEARDARLTELLSRVAQRARETGAQPLLFPGAAQTPQELALQPLAPGEALLICQPAEDAWLCFFADQSGVSYSRPERLDERQPPEELTRALLAPFAAGLRRAARLRVIPSGPLHQLAVGALRLDGIPLAERLELVYSLDLLPGKERPAPREGSVIYMNLYAEQSKKEAAALAAQLGQAGGLTTYGIDRPGDRGVGELSAMLTDRPALFLYLGHAAYEAQQLGSALLGDGGTRPINVGQILTLGARRPRGALILGCEGAQSQESLGREGLGLAPAFVVAGAEWALGSTLRLRPVDAFAVAKALTRGGARGLVARPALALRETLRALRTGDRAPGAAIQQDIALDALRVYVR